MRLTIAFLMVGFSGCVGSIVDRSGPAAEGPLQPGGSNASGGPTDPVTTTPSGPVTTAPSTCPGPACPRRPHAHGRR